MPPRTLCDQAWGSLSHLSSADSGEGLFCYCGSILPRPPPRVASGSAILCGRGGRGGNSREGGGGGGGGGRDRRGRCRASGTAA